MPRRILLADADAFYVSVARLVDPEGAGREPLLIVGGSPEGRGVVTSASYEARAFGVHSAMPMARAIRLCPGAMVVPVSWEACGRLSAGIRETLGTFAPVVEQASQDEFYLDLSGTERLYKDEPLADHGAADARGGARRDEAQRLDRRRHHEAGGQARRHLRQAGRRVDRGAGRRGGVHAPVRAGRPALRRATIPGAARALQPQVGERRVRRRGREPARLVRRARRPMAVGQHPRVSHGVVEGGGDPKSISRDETFPVDIDDDGVLNGELIRLVDRGASDLREDELMARTVSVRLRDHDFTDRQASRTVDEPIISDRAVLRVARELLAKLRKARPVPARLLGVALSNLVRTEGTKQLSLLADHEPKAETEKDRAVARVVDELRRKLGDDAVALGRAPTRKRR